MNESGVLIDQCCGDLISPNERTDVGDLFDLEQWHLSSP
jgi:hypothetical protein